MIRKSFVMQLKCGGEEVYRQRHNPIWLEFTAQIILSDRGRHYPQPALGQISVMGEGVIQELEGAFPGL